MATEPLVTDVTDHPPHEMTTDEFFKLIEAGVFEPHRRIYLWHGRLCEAPAKSLAHAHLVSALNLAIFHRLPEGWFISGENPLVLNLGDAPLPVFTVAEGAPMNFYKENRHVSPADVAVTVDFSEARLPRDMGDRRSRYALAMQHRGGTYLVIDHKSRRFWVHEEPGTDPNSADAGVWNKITEVGPGAAIRLTLRGQALDPIPWEEVMA